MSLMRAETATEKSTLNDLLYRISAQWPIKSENMRAKRQELLAMLREFGAKPATAAVERCLREHVTEAPTKSQFCPPISVFRSYVLPVIAGGKGRGTVTVMGRRWYRNPSCPQCQGKGYVYVPDLEADEVYHWTGSLAVKRCPEPDCLRWQ